MVVKGQNLKKSNWVLGFEVSENSLVVVETQFLKNNINITNAFRLNIPVFQDLNQTITLVRQSLKTLNIKTRDSFFGLSMQYFKLFPVPIPKSIPEDEIDSILIQEGNIDLNNENVAWLPLNNTQRQDPDGILRYDVLGISLPNQYIEFIRALAQKCGLRLIGLTPSFLGLGSFLQREPTGNLTATLWISQIRCEFVVWSAQEPIYEHLFLSHQLNEQVFQAVNYIQAQLPNTQVSTIFSCGPYAKETDLSKMPFNIQELLIPQNFIDVGKVLQRMNLAEIVVALSTACLTWGAFVPNLLVQIKKPSKGFEGIFKNISKVQEKKKKEFKVPVDPQISKFIFISLVIILFSMFANFFIQKYLLPDVLAKQSTFENRFTLAQAHLAKVLNYEKTNKVLNVKIDFFSELLDKRKPWSKILRELADMTPKELWIDRLEIKNGNIDVFGRALDVNAIANFSINLNYTAKFLTKAQIIALRKFQEEGIDIVEFQVSVRVKDSTPLIAKDSKSDTLKVAPKI